MVLFALAMCWGFERDRIRLQMFLNSNPGAKIITVSENNHTLGSMPHLSSDFKTDRGHRKIAKRIKEERDRFPMTQIIVALDYYWLPIHYLGDRYGKLWLESGVSRLLKAGADSVFLPYDDGALHESRGESDMEKMLTGKRHPDVQCNSVPLSSNPLWVASSEQEIRDFLATYPGGDNAETTRKWLSPTSPFVHCSLKEKEF
jgi:hypothetical protein